MTWIKARSVTVFDKVFILNSPALIWYDIHQFSVVFKLKNVIVLIVCFFVILWIVSKIFLGVCQIIVIHGRLIFFCTYFICWKLCMQYLKNSLCKWNRIHYWLSLLTYFGKANIIICKIRGCYIVLRIKRQEFKQLF